MRRGLGLVVLLGLMTPALTAALTAEPDTSPASAAASAQRDPATDEIVTETDFRDAWADPTRTRIDLGADIVLRDCFLGDPIRETPYPMLLDGHGHTIRQSCFEKRVLRQDGTGFLDVRDVTLTRGGSDGPGAALTSRGEIVMSDCAVLQNLAEEPGGGVFSMRRVTVRRCHINGNLANDDGGGIYARRGGVQVYDSVLSTNLVDGSGGAIGSTGDILVVRSQVDGNTTDGDGGALYADEDGDVTVVESLIDGSDADGPGGAIFTLDGDVAVFDSTLIGNRADDRGGAISGEADVLLVNSTVARNLAVAHAGGGVWARGDLVAVNSTVTNNYAEGEGGGVLAAGQAILVSSTIVNNIASVGGNIGASGTLSSFASIVGPPAFVGVTGDTIPTRRSCRVYDVASAGHNFVTDPSCELTKPTDITGDDPKLAQLEDDPNGFVLIPFDGSPVRGRIPSGDCRGELPDPLPAGQLLEGFVDWDEILARDAVGTVRDGGTPCDIGAVQSPTPGARGGRRTVVDPPGPPEQAATAPAPAAYEVVESGAPLQRAHRPKGTSVRERLERLELRLERMNRDARRFDVMLGCMTRVRVQRTGDVRHRWGYVYNERDGTGLDMRPALARTEGQRGWDLLRTSTSPSCLSLPVDPNGTGEDARPLPRALTRTPHQDLWRWLHRLERLFDRVDTRTERFDDWSSCVGALSITEAGDAEQDLGYIVDEGPWPHRQARYPAIDIDDSEWDDPDYQVLAFRAEDQPFRPGPCGTDPGEGVDRTAPTVGPGRDGSARDLREDVAELAEDVADLGEPVEEITQWDECLFTVGMTERSGYVYRDRDGDRLHRSALSFDMRGDELPDMSVLAFPGEEPPQIECNEDASGVETDE
jgi:hypothetical protein